MSALKRLAWRFGRVAVAVVAGQEAVGHLDTVVEAIGRGAAEVAVIAAISLAGKLVRELAPYSKWAQKIPF